MRFSIALELYCLVGWESKCLIANLIHRARLSLDLPVDCRLRSSLSACVCHPSFLNATTIIAFASKRLLSTLHLITVTSYLYALRFDHSPPQLTSIAWLLRTVWLLRSPEVTTQQPSTLRLSTNDNHHRMPPRRNKIAERHDSHEGGLLRRLKN